MTRTEQAHGGQGSRKHAVQGAGSSGAEVLSHELLHSTISTTYLFQRFSENPSCPAGARLLGPVYSDLALGESCVA